MRTRAAAEAGQYHRTHGSFGNEAKRHAVTLDADRARLGVAAAGTAAIVGLGFLIGRATERFGQQRPAATRDRG